MANIERGSDVGFREGYPEVRMLAIGMFNEEDIPGIKLNVEMVKGSFIYRSRDGVFSSNVELQIQVMQLIDGDKISVLNRVVDFDITDTDPLVVESVDVTTFSQWIILGSGQYEVTISVKDVTSGNRTFRQAVTTIPDPDSDITQITSIMMLGKNNDNEDGFVPITTYFIPSRFDTLKFQYQITRSEESPEAEILMELHRFNADSLHARELSGIPHPIGSIGYRGIDYSRTEIIESTSRTIVTETGNILIEYVLPLPRSANYRFSVNATFSDESDDLFKAREFFVTNSANFPNVQNVREFAEPLIYLMRPRDHQRLMQIQDADSLKNEIDRFWLSNIRNPARAREVINLYYTRVEQANKQFSNFKEGWKTDMGMVFILFGPPLQVENTLDISVWFYSYMRNDPLQRFIFTRPRVADQFFPFQHYVLDRQRFYHSVEYDIRRDWLTGNILTRN
ncbi:MAG: GWxTD domain-containing protein [Bacteroidetes bacterium]|nr:GWxTD domain-containing protein [Bacteroidota bacterium]MCH8523115.1 GWxTD domain-containing protein [Balneolales bacterium]